MPEPIIDLGEAWEGDTQDIEYTIVDDQDAGFKPSTLVLTIRDQESGTDIRTATDILSYCDANGNVTYVTESSDLTFVSTKLKKKTAVHLFIFKWTWSSSPTKQKTEVASVEVKPA